MKGKLEAEISAATGKFIKDRLGRGPKQVKVKICDDMLIIRVITYNDPLVEQLKGCDNGKDLISKKRRLLFNSAKQCAIDMFSKLLNGINIQEIYFDSDTDDEEAFFIVKTKENMEKKLELISQ